MMIRNDDLVHENLGGYRVIAEYGSSVFSTTFLGESISPTAASQRVLIKVLSMAGVHTRQERRDILQKISLLQQLHHPHILPILSVGTREGTPYIIIEYLNTESLYDRLQGRTVGLPMDIEEALFILAQVGRALQYAHQQQVIHGYLKPQSVLFNMQDEALVTGFHRHILQLSDDLEDTGPLELSIYRAPELLTSQASEKSDQYALGCMAYDMFTGYRAFMIPSVNMPGTFYKTRSLIAPGRLNPALPSYIEEAILKAMSREPGQRYYDIAAFLAALKISPVAGMRDIKKTVVLPRITLGEVSGVSFTPMPETVKSHVPFDVAVAKDEKRTNPDITIAKDEKRTNLDALSQWLPKTVEQAEATTPSGSVLLDVSSGYMSREDEVTFKILMPYGGSIKPPLYTSRKRSRSKRSLIIIMCLVACIILLTIIVMALNVVMSSKQPETSSFFYVPSVVNSSIPTQVPVPAATQPGSSSSKSGTAAPSQGQDTIPPQGQGGVSSQMPTPAPTVGNSGFLQGVSSISSSQVQFWFLPNGWKAGYMILHYTRAGQVQQNIQMSYNGNAGRWEYTVGGLSAAQTIIYWFSYQQNQMQYNSGTYAYTVSGSTSPTPVPQPGPTPVPTSNNCASSYREGAISVSASQGQFWFSSCGWTASYVIVHYTGTGQAQQNLYMSYVSSAGRWQYTAGGLNSAQTITYWFTYMQNGTQYDSATYTWVHPGK